MLSGIAMQCEVCGSLNPVTNRFCRDCGAAQKITCAVCGQTSDPQARHCGSCGATLKTEVMSSSPAGHLAHASRAELKQVTVLFVDLVSSTEQVAHLDAESAMRHLEPILQTMCETVQRFGGTIARTMGDGIMALFGAPVTQEGHAVLACQAALAIRRAISEGSKGHLIRAGLNSGEIVSDIPIGGAGGATSAYGMTLHLGSRLAAQVDPGEICISEACFRLVKPFCEARLLGQRTLRGVPQAVGLYALLGMRAAVAGQRFRSIAPPPLLGRARELAVLTETLRTVEAGAGQIVGIAGIPGSGKSRLTYEFAEICRARSVPVFETRSQPYGAATPLQPILELLRTAYFHIGPGDISESAIALVARRLADIGAAEEADLSLVCDFLRIPFKSDQRPWLSARTRNARLQEIVRSLVLWGGVATSVVIIEDLHWLDEASDAFVATLARAVAAVRTMLIVNYRQPYGREWMQVSNYRQIDLAELTAADTEALVGRLIGSRPELSEVRRRVAERSGGNPFFVEELVQSLAESGVVVGRRGAFRRGHAAVMEALPGTVQAVIGARIDGLAERERHVLQIGSVIGKEFDVAILEGVTAHEPDALGGILDRLCDAELLQRGDPGDGSACRFRHPLIQEVAYTTQLKSQRSVLHAAVAEAIERLHGDHADEYAGLVAHHLEEAGERSRAAFSAARAAHWIGQMSSEQAINLWHKVRVLMSDEPRSRRHDTLRIEASSQIAWQGWREGLTADQARPFVQEALGWARETDDSVIPLLLLVDGRITQVSGGNSDTFVAQLKQAIAMAEASRDTGRLATLNAALSHAYGWAGLLRQALKASDAALACIADVTEFDQRLLGYRVADWILGLRGRILMRLGRFDEARGCFDKLISIQTLIDPTVLFIAHVGYVDMAWCLDDAAMAAEHASRIGVLAERHGGAYLRLYQLATKAIADGIAGDHDRAVNGTVRSIEFLRQTRAATEFEPELLASLADYQMRRGDHARAMATAEDAVAMARQRGARLPACRAAVTLAGLVLLIDGPEAETRATELLTEAERLVEESGIRIYDSRLNEVRALLSHAGRRAASGSAG